MTVICISYIKILINCTKTIEIIFQFVFYLFRYKSCSYIVHTRITVKSYSTVTFELLIVGVCGNDVLCYCFMDVAILLWTSLDIDCGRVCTTRNRADSFDIFMSRHDIGRRQRKRKEASAAMNKALGIFRVLLDDVGIDINYTNDTGKKIWQSRIFKIYFIDLHL